MSLRVEDLRVYYQTLEGEVKALDGVSFAIADGEIMGLAGESGCGKSTLAQSIVRLVPPMKLVGGVVELDGEKLPIDDFEAMNRHRMVGVSIVPQYAMSALNPTRKIGKLIKELLGARGISYRAKLPELENRLQLVGLPREVLDMYPIELSGGMKQRVVMVISTLLDPSLLIADEITSALDVSTQRAVAEMLVDFRDREIVKSMMVVTHDVSILYQIADSILIMYAGQPVERGPAEVITHAPRHPYTQLLVGSLPQVGVRYDEQPLSGIAGNPPGLIDPPSGCRFRPRCPFASERCESRPPLVEIGDGHSVACWKVMEEEDARV